MARKPIREPCHHMVATTKVTTKHHQIVFFANAKKRKQSVQIVRTEQIFHLNLSRSFYHLPFILSTLHAHSFCTPHLSEWLVAKPFSLFQGDFDGGWHLHRKMDGLRRILLP